MTRFLAIAILSAALFVAKTVGNDDVEEECNKGYCSSPNEEYKVCKQTCPPDLCSSLMSRLPCTEPPCVAGCGCKTGYFRVKENSPCIPMCECPGMEYAPVCAPQNQ